MAASFLVKLQGVSHSNSDGSDRQELIRRCRPGLQLTLVAEPDNPHDRNAVAVFSPSGEHLGYLPSDARDASSLLRAEPISAKVEKLIGGPSWWQRILGIKRHYGLLVRLEKGAIDWQAHNSYRAMAASVDEMVANAISAEENSEEPSSVVEAYARAMEGVISLNLSNPVAAAHRFKQAPINRFTMLLIKLKRQEEALSAYQKWRSVRDPVGLTRSDQSALEKRMAKISAATPSQSKT